VPLSYSEELYHLRMHIDMLRSKLKQMIENSMSGIRILNDERGKNETALL